MDFYAYIYSYNNVPFYVGKGQELRAYDHVKKHWLKSPVTYKCRKLLKEGKEPSIKIINCNSEIEAFELEKFLIAEIGRKDLGLGSLLNMTDGGEGTSGRKHTEEAKRKIGNGNRFPRPYAGTWKKGQRASPATEFKPGQGHGMKSGDSRLPYGERNGMSKPEYRVKVSASKLGRRKYHHPVTNHQIYAFPGTEPPGYIFGWLEDSSFNRGRRKTLMPDGTYKMIKTA